MSDCQGTIQNNIIRQNMIFPAYGGGFKTPGQTYEGHGGALLNCSGVIRDNTIVDNYVLRSDKSLLPGGMADCTGVVTNNIVYNTTMTATMEYDGCSTPTACLFREARAGQGNVVGDPQFVDPANGDFHLHSGSPCIGAGQAIPDVKADFSGVQRGLKTTTVPGQPGATDIGAFEFVPKPVAVWLQDGAPDQIIEGQKLAVGWALDLYQAGTAINLRLIKDGQVIDDFGDFWNPAGVAIETIALPAPLAWLGEYRIEGRSSFDPSQTFISPPFAIQGTLPNAVRRGWAAYQ
jgi:hypothetical protein